MVYEKGDLLVFKNFLLISQLFVVPSVNVATKFCNHLCTRSVKCRDIARNVATFFLMLF